MSLSIDVVIPVCNESEYTKGILEDISAQTVMPQRIFIIDNGSTDDTPDICAQFAKEIPLTILRNEKNIGVNASWNLGLSWADADIVSVLNNDLILPKFFFRKIEETLRKREDCGIAIPRTTQDIEEPKKIPDNKDNYLRSATIREGWAFSIRRELAEKIGPIPSQLYTFYGDDWFFYGVKGLGFSWLVMMDNPVYHYLSRTLYSSGGAEYCGSDQDAWSILISRDKPVRHWTSIPYHQDMSPYVAFYQDCIKRALENISPDDRLNILEFYSRWGVSARMMLSALPQDRNWKMTVVETNSSPELFEVVDNVRVEFWKGNIEQFADKIPDNWLGVLHIDADPHTYEQTKEYFDLFESKIKVGGIIIFHDCTKQFGVLQFVNELEQFENWDTWRSQPHSSCPVAAPAAAVRLK